MTYNYETMDIDIAGILNNEVRFDYIHSPGPGGQNVNKLASAVQLRFDAAGSKRLPEAVKARLSKLAGNRITAAGEIIIDAHNHRSQEMNRQDAIKRLTELIQKALIQPKKRHATRPTRTSQEKRLLKKKHRSEIKRGRISPMNE